jgi:hypothetical protein
MFALSAYCTLIPLQVFVLDVNAQLLLSQQVVCVVGLFGLRLVRARVIAAATTSPSTLGATVTVVRAVVDSLPWLGSRALLTPIAPK